MDVQLEVGGLSEVVQVQAATTLIDTGVIGRTVPGDILCFSPPLIISEAEVNEMLDRVGRALDELTVQLRREQIAVVR